MIDVCTNPLLICTNSTSSVHVRKKLYCVPCFICKITSIVIMYVATVPTLICTISTSYATLSAHVSYCTVFQPSSAQVTWILACIHVTWADAVQSLLWTSGLTCNNKMPWVPLSKLYCSNHHLHKLNNMCSTPHSLTFHPGCGHPTNAMSSTLLCNIVIFFYENLLQIGNRRAQ